MSVRNIRRSCGAFACLVDGLAVPMRYVWEVWFTQCDGRQVTVRAKEVWNRKLPSTSLHAPPAAADR